MKAMADAMRCYLPRFRSGAWLAVSLLCGGCAQFGADDAAPAVPPVSAPVESVAGAPASLPAPDTANAVAHQEGETTALPPATAPVAVNDELPVAPIPDSVRDAADTANADRSVAMQSPPQRQRVSQLCDQVGNKLGSVSVQDCNRHRFVDSGGQSVNGRPLVVKERSANTQAGSGDFKVLLMGGIHGDEYSSISIIFKWLDLFAAQGLEGEFHWLFAPVVNPDGLLDGARAKRQNANGVDLNRNFPSQDWSASAVAYWQQSTGSNPRRYPGKQAASEPEVQWLVEQIERFQPDVIVSVHAPYHLLDFDGPLAAPDRIGELYLHQLGVYPGSLGNYAGLNKRIPVVTLELPSAGIMPPADQIALMWHDLVHWLDQEGRKALREPGAGAPVVSSAAAE